MANEGTKIPGGLSGMTEVMAGPFDKPPSTLKAFEAAKLAYQEAKRRHKDCKYLKVSEKPAWDGQLFDALGEYIAFPKGAAYRRCYVVLLDPSPQTRWGHPAFWAFVPADGEGEIIFYDTELPEAAEGPLCFFAVDMARMEEP